MADRYWVGGTATWDATAGTKWSTTSGGAGGASVPGGNDNVFFDQAGSYTVTFGASYAVTCANFTSTSTAVTFAGTPNFITVNGSFSVSGATIWNSNVAVTFTGLTNPTNTVTTNGVSIGGANGILLDDNGSGGSITLGSALTISSSVSIARGTFNTANYNVTATQLFSSTSNARTINLGSSTVTLTGTAVSVLNFATNTNLTFNAGTSTVAFTGSSVNITCGATSGTGVTFYNVSLSNTATPTYNFVAINTFNNLTVSGPASAGVVSVTFDSRQTISGTLSTTGTAGNRRVWFRGATYGIAQTLTINSAPSLTDADFRDIYVIGTAAPISGTRIGDLRGCRGITFSTPKTVYWNLAGAQNWSANGWATTSTGTPSTDNFPLAQDTATFTNAGSVTGTITLNTAIPYTGSIDMSGRTTAMTLALNAFTIYGSWTNGSGTSITISNTLTFSGRNTQTITSAGKTFSGGITVDSYGGTVELADALNIGTNTLTVTNGTFDTKNFNVTAGTLSSNNSNVRTITLGSSTVTLSSDPVTFTTSTNLTFNAGTSTLSCSGTTITFNGGGQTFYDVEFTNTGTSAKTVAGVNTFRNLVFAAPTSTIQQRIFANNQTITGTLTVAGATAVRRGFSVSSVLGTTRTLTVGTLSAQDCDFRDITIAGAAAGSSPTRAGDCGGNSGITFPAPKTVYWNLSTASNWFGNGWCPTSGGTPDVNSFPLAQDTAVFDDAGSATDVNPNVVCNIGTINASARTTAINMQFGACSIYGNVTLSSAITIVSSGTGPTFSGRGTQTITSNGRTFNNPITIDCLSGTVQLADALTLGSTRILTLTSGTFDAVTYNVTTGLFNCLTPTNTVLKMGSGTWTISGTGSIWMSTNDVGTFYKGTANIVLSDTSTSARTFTGNGRSYNKLTIGGATGTSTLTIIGNNQFTELASTKTVAHTIALGTTTQTFGAWTVTGTVGNVVTLTGTGTSHVLAGACTSGINYLAMGSIGFAATSPGEFYAGVNSTGTAGAPVYRTAKPADSTRYWVGGTGNWSDTARWSASSGGASGASVPRSHDDVVFDSASNATDYTATVNAVTGGVRMKSLTIAGPASGNLTLAGTTAIVGIHGNVTLPATGLTRTYTGAITLSSSSTGLTFTTNGNTLASDITINGVNCGWSLGSALNIGTSGVQVSNGSFDLATYNLTANTLLATGSNSRTLDLDTGTITLSASTPLDFGSTETSRATLTFTASTSQINCSSTNPTFTGNNQTFYNVSFTSTAVGTVTINGTNTFNNLSFTGTTSAGLKNISVTANQTINGTLTLSAGTDATMRHFVRSDTLGTTRTLTCAAFSGTDADFRDITIAGAAAPVSGTRLGDCKGNSGITFDAAKTVYWSVTTSGLNWGSANWALTNGGAGSANNFPLAQDTAVFPTLYPSGTLNINANYNIGSIDMSARTSSAMTLATSTNTPTIYGNWINGTGTTLTGTGIMTFAGRGSQTITSAGKTFTQGFTINTPGGSVAFQDAFTVNVTSTFTHTAGTLDGNGYNVTLSNSSNSFTTAGTATRTLAIGSGTWTFAGIGSTAFNASTSTNLTVTGTGTISLTAATAKTFQGGGVSYSGITLDQGGAGTLTITGNNTFKDITNSYSATGATNITLGTTTQTVTQWTATGTSGKVLTVQGTSATTPATLILTGGTDPAVDYLAITGVRAYSLTDTWYAGANSTNNGSLGWYFEAGVVVIIATVTETASGSDVVQVVASIFNPAVSETAAGADSVLSRLILLAQITESASGADVISALQEFVSTFSDTATGTDTVAPPGSIYNAPVVETVVISDAVIGAFLWNLINDAQTPNWQNISTTQSVTWTLVDDSQNPNWQNITTLN